MLQLKKGIWGKGYRGSCTQNYGELGTKNIRILHPHPQEGYIVTWGIKLMQYWEMSVGTWMDAWENN